MHYKTTLKADSLRIYIKEKGVDSLFARQSGKAALGRSLGRALSSDSTIIPVLVQRDSEKVI